uniref:SlpX n=1 Tax=Lactobacillus acidophilus TaxID=1579 RepID=UPI0022AB4E5C|nr:Chain A, SlpX [Lactobacillus acidophilus]7QFI_B Chain B, SlpX [Lactobacillus acidophilus]
MGDTAVNVGSAAGTGANTTNTTTQAPQNKPYFTYNNEIIGEATQSNPLGNVVRTTISFKSDDKVSDLISTISKAVQFHKNNSASGENVTINENDFINQLKANGVTVKTVQPSNKNEKAYEAIDKVPSTSFNITLSATGDNNQTATIQIPMVPQGLEHHHHHH